QDAQVERFRGLIAAAADLERGQPEQRIAVARLLAQRLLVFVARGGEVAGHIGRVSRGHVRIHLRRRTRDARRRQPWLLAPWLGAKPRRFGGRRGRCAHRRLGDGGDRRAFRSRGQTWNGAGWAERRRKRGGRCRHARERGRLRVRERGRGPQLVPEVHDGAERQDAERAHGDVERRARIGLAELRLENFLRARTARRGVGRRACRWTETRRLLRGRRLRRELERRALRRRQVVRDDL